MTKSCCLYPQQPKLQAEWQDQNVSVLTHFDQALSLKNPLVILYFPFNQSCWHKKRPAPKSRPFIIQYGTFSFLFLSLQDQHSIHAGQEMSLDMLIGC